MLENMEVSEFSEFSTASGDVELTGLIIGEDCEFSTASGNVRCRQCTGPLALSSASGDVEVRDCQLTDWGSFSTASGDVEVYLKSLPSRGLKASTASGRVTFDCNNFGDNFTLVMTKRQGRGRIRCPFEFTYEDTYADYHIYEEKIVERGTGEPEIILHTASGSVIVKN